MTGLRALLVACLMLFFLAPAASVMAFQNASVSVAKPAAANACAANAPPCGYIVPQLSLEFPDKPTCRAEKLGGAIALEECLPLPAVGESVTQQGLMRMSWDITQDGTYPADPAQPIVISFTGTATNPKWMAVTADPAEVTLTAADLASPANMKVDQGTQQVFFWYEVPLTITFERTASPDEAGIARIDRTQGVTQVFLKVKSTASGAYFKEAFGVEEFRFNSCNPPAGLEEQVEACGNAAAAQGAPGLGLTSSLLVLGLAALAVRRRSRSR